MLMRRILDRLERTCAATGEDMLQATAEYISRWFRFHPHKSGHHRNHPRPPPMRRVSTLATDSESSTGASEVEEEAEEATDYDDGSCESDWEDCVKKFPLTNPEAECLPTLADSKFDGCEKTNIFKWALKTLCYDDVNDLLACFFMGKSVDKLEDWERVELKKLFDYLEDHFDLRVQKGEYSSET